MALVRTSPFDALFARHAGAIPQPYLRALAYRESTFRPDAVNPKSRATGLFQITSAALKDYNAANRTALALAHLTDPEANTRVAVHHLRSVMDVYRRHRSLTPDWSSRRWVELLTLGWNAGHNAVARLAARMEAAGVPTDRITADSMSQLARATGQAKYVADPVRLSWAKSVASLFLGGGQVPAAGAPAVASMGPAAGGGGLFALALALATAGAVVFWGRRAS